jgi:hypothetical protein
VQVRSRDHLERLLPVHMSVYVRGRECRRVMVLTMTMLRLSLAA